MILPNRNLNMDTRGIVLDVEGAFDAIPHFLLVHEIRSYGLMQILLNWWKIILVP
jgi:hypothetical protein